MYHAYAVEQLLRYVVAHEWLEVRDRSRRHSDTVLSGVTGRASAGDAEPTTAPDPYRLRPKRDRERAWNSLLKHADWVARQAQRYCGDDDDRAWTAVAVCGAQLPLAIDVLPPGRRLLVHDHECTAKCWAADLWEPSSNEPVNIVIASNSPRILELQASAGNRSVEMDNLLNTVRATERVLHVPTAHEFVLVDNLEDWRHRVHRLGVSYAYKLHYRDGTSWHKWRLHVLIDSCGALAYWLCKLKRARVATKWQVLDLMKGRAWNHDTPPPPATVALRKHFYGLEQRETANRAMTDYVWMNALRYEAYRHTVCSTAWHPMFYPPEVLLLLRHPSRPRYSVTLQVKLRLDWLHFITAMKTSRDSLLLAWRVELTRFVMGDAGPASYVDRLLTVDDFGQKRGDQQQHDQHAPVCAHGVDRGGAGGATLRLVGKCGDERAGGALSVRVPSDVSTTVLLPLFGQEDERLFGEVMTVLAYCRARRDADRLLAAYLSFVRLNQRLAKPFAGDSVDFALCALDADCVRRLLRGGYRVQGGEIVAEQDEEARPTRITSGVDLWRRWAV